MTLYERQPKDIKNEDLKKAFKHATSGFPMEVCGVFTKSAGYIACTNIAADKEATFTMKEYKQIAANEDDVIAIFHSHTDNSQYPSCQDMEIQIASNKPWGIAHLDENGGVIGCFFWGSDNIPNLIGRTYRSGTMDCYSLIKDTYKKWYNIELPEFPRDNEFWKSGEDLYTKGFKKAGFKVIDLTDLKAGDVVLGSIQAKGIVNHGAIVLDGNVILHHLENKLSRRDSFGRWIKHLNIGLRHKDLTDVKRRSAPSNID